MNSSDDTPDRDLLERYRQASSGEALVPRDAVRAAILEEGRRAAVGFSESSSREQVRRWSSRWKMTALATAATVLIAAFVIAPKLWEQERRDANAGGVTDPFKQAAVRKAQPDAAEYASTPPVPVVPVQQSPAPMPRATSIKPQTRSVPEPPSMHDAEQRAEFGAPSQRSNAAAHTLPSEFARRQGVSGPLSAAVSSGDSVKAAQLLDQGTFVDERDEDGRTPLMLAVAAGKLDLVQLLLAHGADPNAGDRNGITALKQAQQKGYAEIEAALAQARAR